MTITMPSSDSIEKTDADELFRDVASTPDGLSSADAKQRLEEVGPNALEEEHTSIWKQIFRYFWGPIPWMIEIAAILSAVAGDWNDFIIITALLVFNAVIGFLEEHRAANALASLKAGLALSARAKRDGQWTEVPAAELVPGDIVRLRLGDVIPADCKLLEGDYISIDQAALTGESLPVNKKAGDVAYSGSVAKQGEMVALVCCTGTKTFFGKTASLVANAKNVSHFQQAVMRVGNFLIIVALALCVLLSIVLLHRLTEGPGITFNSVLSLSKFILVLAVAAIPVAMPAVLSITMALGALALSKAKAIVSQVQDIEEMAGVDVLCSDKTGTLTQNKLTVDTPITFGDDGDPARCSLVAALGCRAENNDPIDNAVLAACSATDELATYTQQAFVPFDPISKRTQATVADPSGEVFLVSKGAPQVIVDLCGLDENASKAVLDKVAEVARHGYRTLGVARSAAVADASVTESAQWEFLGVLPLSDPPREDSAATIAAAKEYGLSVKMVTGDDTAIAEEISGQLGLGTKIQVASDIFNDVDPDHIGDRLAERIEKADGFARVFPEHKYGIVKALQSRNHIVAMTGDGVNDAPALKQADAGVAVQGATDAARAAADIVLTAPGLSVIITAITAARQIFERMLSYTIYRIAMTIAVMFFVVAAIIFFPHVDGVAGSFVPLTPVMIILLALLDDIPIMTIAYDNTRIPKNPVRWNMPRVLIVSTVLGLVAVLQTFGMLSFFIDRLGDPLFGHVLTGQQIQTAMFVQLICGGQLMLLATRQRGSLFSRPAPAWKLLAALAGTQIFTAVLCLVGSSWLGIPAIPFEIIVLVWIYNLIWLMIQDGAKLLTYKIMDKTPRLTAGVSSASSLTPVTAS